MKRKKADFPCIRFGAVLAQVLKKKCESQVLTVAIKLIRLFWQESAPVKVRVKG
jgi:hypothetical protein